MNILVQQSVTSMVLVTSNSAGSHVEEPKCSFDLQKDNYNKWFKIMTKKLGMHSKVWTEMIIDIYLFIALTTT